MFLCGVYAYSVASEIIWQQYINPVTHDTYKPSEAVIVITAIFMAMMVFPQLMPIIPATFAALVSSKKVHDVIERKPLI